MWQSWLTAVFGLWLLISPWIFNFTTNTGALWNNFIFGLLVIILSAWVGSKYNDSSGKS